VRECTYCREQYPATARVCTDCARPLTPVTLAAHGRRVAVPVAWALGAVVAAGLIVAGVRAGGIADLGAVAGSDRVGGHIALPADAPTASADQVPDRRARPEVSCAGGGVPSDCVAWRYTIPEDVGAAYTVAADDTLVLVRTRQHLRAIHTRTGEVAWEREDSAPSGWTPRVWLIDEFVVTADGATLRTFTRPTGTPVGAYRLPAHPLDATSDDDHLYVALPAAPGHLPPIQAWTPSGTRAWNQALPATWLDLRPRRILLHVGHDGLLIVDGAFGRHTGTDARAAFDPATGERIARGTVTDRFLPVTETDGSEVRVIDTATGQVRLTVGVDQGRIVGLPASPPWVVSIRTDDGQHLVRLRLDAMLDR
jgi:hypothetical protein